VFEINSLAKQYREKIKNPAAECEKLYLIKKESGNSEDREDWGSCLLKPFFVIFEPYVAGKKFKLESKSYLPSKSGSGSGSIFSFDFDFELQPGREENFKINLSGSEILLELSKIGRVMFFLRVKIRYDIFSVNYIDSIYPLDIYSIFRTYSIFGKNE